MQVTAARRGRSIVGIVAVALVPLVMVVVAAEIVPGGGRHVEACQAKESEELALAGEQHLGR